MSIVLELQREAYLKETSVSILIRKAYTVARKLGVKEFVDWSEKEMNGYQEKDELPRYRVVYGYLKAFNPYRGYIPAYFPKELEKLMNNRAILVSITEIEHYIRQGNDNTGTMLFKFDSDLQMKFMKASNADFEVSLHIPVTQFNKIDDTVRNIILEWTLKLEEKGILGTDITFNDDEKKAANQISSITNIIGTMVNSQLQQSSDNANQTLILENFNSDSLKPILEQGYALLEELTDMNKKAELQADLIVIETQLNSPKPKKNIISESLSSVKNIAEGAIGSVVASGLLEAMKLLGL